MCVCIMFTINDIMFTIIVGEGIHGGIYIHNDIIFGIDELLKYRVDWIEAVTRDDRAT